MHAGILRLPKMVNIGECDHLLAFLHSMPRSWLERHLTCLWFQRRQRGNSSNVSTRLELCRGF